MHACDSALILTRNISDFKKDNTAIVSYMLTVSEKEYNDLKHNADAGVSIPIPEVESIIKASAGYSDFQTKVREYLKTVSYSLNEQQSLRYAHSFVPDTAIKAWASCMLNNDLLALAARFITDVSFYVKVVWNLGQGRGHTTLTITVDEGGEVRNPTNGRMQRSYSQRYDGDKDLSFYVQRELGKDTKVSVDNGIHADVIFVPKPLAALPALPPPPPPIQKPDQLISINGNCDRRTVIIHDGEWNRQLIIEMVRVAPALDNCKGPWEGAIDWGQPYPGIVNQIYRAIGRRHPSKTRYALLEWTELPGGTHKRRFRLFNNATGGEETYDVDNSTQVVDFTGSPRETARKVAELMGLQQFIP